MNTILYIRQVFKKLSIPNLLVLGILFATPGHARPDFTEEELAKARKAASETKYPIDFDTLMDEMDRLGVECEGDLTNWAWIRICSLKIEAAQHDEKIEASKKRVEESKKRQEATRQETIRLINEAADTAERKLLQMDRK